MFRYLVVVLSLLLSSCVFRLYNYSDNGSKDQIDYFDIYPPVVEVVYPYTGSLLSNVVTVYGKAWDKSSFFVYFKVSDKFFVFTNANEWFYALNTFDYSNGNISLYFWAEDMLGNRSTNIVRECIISNSSFISVLPSQNIIVTNFSFDFNINLTLEANREVLVLINSNEVMRISNTNVFVVNILTNGYTENATNEFKVISLEITNIKLFVFDFSPPSFVFNLNSNSYIWGEFNIPVNVNDTNNCFLYISLGGLTNGYFLSSGLTNILLDTYIYSNGTNILGFFGKDISGNSGNSSIIPVIVCNFFRNNLLIDSRYKYYLDYEFVSNKVWLFFTDDSYSKIFLAREENNYQKEIARNYIYYVDRKIRSVSFSDTLFVSYLDDNNSLFIRTNTISNTLSSALVSVNGVYDFEISKTVDNLYLIRLHTNLSIIVSDISNKVTNFIISNLNYAYSIATDKYNSDDKFRIVVIKTNPNGVELYGCSSNYYTKIFETNLTFMPDVASICRSFGYEYLCVAGTNRVSMFVLSNGNLITNFSFTNSGGFVGIASSRYNSGVVFAFSEFFYSSLVSNLKLVYFEGVEIRRCQDIGNVGRDYETIKYINIVPYNDKLLILLPFMDDGSTKGVAKFEGI